MLVPEYFRDDELVCRCGCGKTPNDKSTERLYAVRIMLQTPLPISSAARCKKQNKKVGGAADSMHLYGRGFDIIANRQLQSEIFIKAFNAGFTGFGFAKDFIHIDDGHKEITIWRY